MYSYEFSVLNDEIKVCYNAHHSELTTHNSKKYR
jgi:hypothetical protein